MDTTESRQLYGIDLKASFTSGKSTLWHDSPLPKPVRFTRTGELILLLQSTVPGKASTLAVDAPLTFAAADLFIAGESMERDIEALSTIERWRRVNCWTTRPWEKFVAQALVADDALRDVLWQDKTRKNNRVDRVPVINVKGFGGLDLSIRGLWLRRLVEGLGFKLADACCGERLQLIEVHPALSLALWWQERRTDRFPDYKSAWSSSIEPLARLLKEVDDRTPTQDAFDNDDDLDCFVAWLMASFFHTNRTITLGCLRDGFVVVPRTSLAITLANQCASSKAEMEVPPRTNRRASQ